MKHSIAFPESESNQEHVVGQTNARVPKSPLATESQFPHAIRPQAETQNPDILDSDIEQSEQSHHSIELLTTALSQLFAVRLKSQVYHWNFHGPQFYGVHKLLEELYQFLDRDIDSLAERIRTLGGRTPSSYTEIEATSGHLAKSHDKFLRPDDMIDDLLQALKTLKDDFLNTIDLVQRDPVSEDLLTQILGRVEKSWWLIRSTKEF